MVDVQNELESIETFILSVNTMTGAKTHLQNIPNKYKANDLSIQFVKGDSESETSYHYRLDRLFQITYFGSSELDCLVKMEQVESKFNNEFKIPLLNTTRYLSIGSFSLSKPSKTESGVFTIIGMLNASYREIRTQPTYEKINRVTIKLNNLSSKGD